jgi:C1A family cysteine protease
MKQILTVLIIISLLVACNTPPQPPTFPLTSTEAWTTPVPPDAQVVTPEVFLQRLENNDLRLLPSATLEQQRVVRMQNYQQNLAALQSMANPNETLGAFLNQATQTPDADAAPSAAFGSSQIVFNGVAVQAQQLKTAFETAALASNALAAYTTAYDLLPSNLQSQLPTPSSLQGASFEQIQTVLTDLNLLLGTLPTAGATRVTNAPRLQTQVLVSGNGSDNDGVCVPQQLFARYWFALKNFVSPTKQQGARGLCWAFSTVGALESRERVQNGLALDLSEQFLANKVKESWSRADYHDGYGAESALQNMIRNTQSLPAESFWTYNPAYGRNGAAPTESSTTPERPRFVNSCSNPMYSGTCSDTAHQSNAFCATFPIGTFCATETVNFAGAGITASPSVALWNTGSAFDLNRYEQLLNNGYTLLATFPVYKGFMDTATNGFVSDYRRVRNNPDTMAVQKELPSSYGDHVVQIVGFIRNAALKGADAANPALGGGYFIIKNSWGCNGGDAGYYYIPAAYVEQIFYNLSYLEFDARRSSAWMAEQATPGGLPSIQSKANPNTVDLRISTDLANLFTITHPIAKTLNVVVRSSSNAVIYNGAWLVDALAPASIPYTFTNAGLQSLSVTAQWSGQETTQNISFNVVNTKPYATLNAPDPLYTYQGGVPTPTFNLIVIDKNEINSQDLCATVRWEVELPDLIESDSITNTVTGGCTQKIRFAQAGYRTIQITLTDSDGLSANYPATYYVQPAPANPNPSILSGGVKNWDRLGQFNCLTGSAYPNGVTLNLTALAAASTGCNGQPNPRTLQGFVNIQNPDNEPLSYAWRLSILSADITYYVATSNEQNFPVPYITFGLGGTYPCNVDVKVTPTNEPSRAKQQIVWTGQCQVAAFSPK